MALVRVRAGEFEIEVCVADGDPDATSAAVYKYMPIVVDLYRQETSSTSADRKKEQSRQRSAAYRRRKKERQAVDNSDNSATQTLRPVTQNHANVTLRHADGSPYNPLNINNNNPYTQEDIRSLRVTDEEDSNGNPLPEQDWAEIQQSYYTEFGVLMPQGIREDDVYRAYQALGKDVVVLAIQHTARSIDGSTGRHPYLMAVLKAWQDAGVKTTQDASRQIDEHRNQTRRRSGVDERTRIKADKDYCVPGTISGVGWGNLL